MVHGGRTGESSTALLGKGSVYLLGTAGQVLASFLALPLLTRTLDAREFGLVASAVVVTQLIRVLAEGGLGTAITLDYFAEKGPVRARRLAGATVVIGAMVVMLAHLTGPVWVRAFAGLSYGSALKLAVWSALPLVALVAGQAVLRAQGRAGAFVLSSGLSTLGAQALGIGVAVVVSPDAASYLLGVLIGYGVAAGVACWQARMSFAFRGHISELPPALALAWPSVPHGLALYVLQAGDRIVIERVDGLVAVGRYQAAYLVGAAVVSVLQAINNAWAPLIYEAPEDRRNEVMAETTSVLLRVTSLAIASLAMVAPAALHLAAPSSYRPSDLVTVATVVSLSALPYCLYLANVHAIFVARRTRVLALVTPFAAVTNVGLNLLFVPVLGLSGAAAATVAAYSAQALILHRASKRSELPVSGQLLVGCVAFAAAGAAAGALLPSSGWMLIVRGGALVALLAMLVSLIREKILS